MVCTARPLVMALDPAICRGTVPRIIPGTVPRQMAGSSPAMMSGRAVTSGRAVPVRQTLSGLILQW